jgi:hypothetical protein
MEGRPLQQPSDSDSFPTLKTLGGRTLRADGGVFPDLVVEDDTLSTVEQNLLIEAARAQFPLTLRITEFAFEHARRAQEGSGPEELTPEALEPFYRQLEQGGLPAELLQEQEARDYLSWRVRMAFGQRAERYDYALQVQAERDRVLAEALKLLKSADSQVELFAAAETEAAAFARTRAAGSAAGNRE